jgi:anthranilate synthase component I
MPLSRPYSLAEARRLATGADTVLLRASREADLETPVGAFLALDDGGPAYLLESVEGGERVGRYSFLGVGPRRMLEVRDGVARTITRPVEVDAYAPDLPVTSAPAPDPLHALRGFVPRRRVAPLDGMPRFTGGAVGALAYDAISAFEPVPLPDADPVAAPTAAFMETDLVLVFDHLTHTLSAIASLHTDAPDFEGRYRIAERAVFEALERTARPAHRRSTPPPSATGDVSAALASHGPTSLEREAFEAAVVNAKAAITAGEAIQIVLARRQSFPIPAGADGQALDGLALYRALRRVNPSPYLFFVRTPSFEVVGASPELLLRVEGDRLTTHPIAGTRPRGADDDEDELLSEELQRDPKERAEHVMLVDLGRNDLGRVARPGSVAVTRYMEVERYSHVLHLVSHVEARLRPELDALDALRSVFPAGTLSGAPKVRAMQLIASLERERRGLYGGAVGYLGYDGGLDTAITIRSAVLTSGLVHIHSGAGIVAGSQPDREYEETEHKAAALRRALELATEPAGTSPAHAAGTSGPAAGPGTPARLPEVAAGSGAGTAAVAPGPVVGAPGTAVGGTAAGAPAPDAPAPDALARAVGGGRR